MNKKLIAIAVAGALGAPALALAQNYQIYGKVRVDYNFLDSGSVSKTTDLLNSYDSGVGIKGEEKLGGGLSAWFQCESTINVLGGNDGWCARNSGVGFKGSFGNFFVGNWDTAAKIASGKNRPFSTSGAFGIGSLLWNESQSNAINNGASFTRRQQNLLSYHSPVINGFQFLGSASAANEATAITTASPLKPRLWSLGATYGMGPLTITAAYETHNDYNPGALVGYTGGDDTAWAFSAGYKFAGAYKISAYYTKTKYENVSAQGADLEVKAWSVLGDLALGGPHGLRVGYTQADDTTGLSTVAVGSLAAAGPNTGAELFAIQYVYDFSKRTEFNVGYVNLSNDPSSRHRLQSTAARPSGLDRDQSAFVLGVIHSF